MQHDDQNDQGDTQDQFDALFEPFELDETPPPDESLPPRPATPPPAEAAAGDTGPIPRATQTIGCPSCGAQNPTANRHCEQCGARLSQDPLPVAAPPTLRSSAGGRALGVLAAVVLVVALGVLLFNVFGGGDGDTAAEDTSSRRRPRPLPRSSKSSRRARSSPARNWRDSRPRTCSTATPRPTGTTRAPAARTLGFGSASPGPFRSPRSNCRTSRTKRSSSRTTGSKAFRSASMTSMSTSSDRLDDTQEPSGSRSRSLDTTVLTISVTSTIPAQAVGDSPPFDELALESVRFFGTER